MVFYKFIAKFKYHSHWFIHSKSIQVVLHLGPFPPESKCKTKWKYMNCKIQSDATGGRIESCEQQQPQPPPPPPPQQQQHFFFSEHTVILDFVEVYHVVES